MTAFDPRRWLNRGRPGYNPLDAPGARPADEDTGDWMHPCPCCGRGGVKTYPLDGAGPYQATGPSRGIKQMAA